jgi:NADH dehydrogenase/NADH:ubiquinone oxidoreductase subunit G
MPHKAPLTLTMEIDHRPVTFPEGVTVQRAAELSGVAIPSLCSHKDLSPFGGCRLCMVEIEGMRGYPLSCSTAAREGMKVLTDTATLRDLRRDILKLILSEHPSSCLICDERNACRDFQTTIRKTGVSTGCRFCPNDTQCELQDLVEKLGVAEVDFPIRYHGHEAEHDDPFYDRDYNICILCGRCVRMCQEVRGSAVLAFTYRGPKVKIGPAFGRSHAAAGCEFCGACVDICPTGALADKASKWEGKPDRHLVSTCPFCPLGCQVELAQKNGRLTKVRAHLDPEVNDGQLCLRGRFCLPEATRHFDRAKRPMLKKGEYFREVAWDEAIEKVAAVLKDVAPEDFLMLVSPDLTNESLFAAQRFVRGPLGSPNIDSTARAGLPGGLGLWSELFARPVSIKAISKADAILAVGLDSRFDFSVVGTKVRQAIAAGAKLVTVDSVETNLARYARLWLRPQPGLEGRLFRFLVAALSGRPVEPKSEAVETSVDAALLADAVRTLKGGGDLTVILGPRVFHYRPNDALAEGVRAAAGLKEVNLIPLYFGANARGAMEMGVFPEIGPGGAAPVSLGYGLEDVLTGARRPKVIYLVGDVTFFERPDCDFLIVQDIYLPPFPVEAFLPAASFAEAGGTVVNLEGRVQEIVPAEVLPEGAVTGFMRPDWRIFSDLAGAIGRDSFGYETAADVRREIAASVPGFPADPNRAPRIMRPFMPTSARPSNGGPPGEGDFFLIAAPGGYGHRGIDLSSKVGGLKELGLEEGFRMNPADMGELGLAAGDSVRIIFDPAGSGVSGQVKSDPECPPRAVLFTRPAALGGLAHRRGLAALYALPRNPWRVRVRRETP